MRLAAPGGVGRCGPRGSGCQPTSAARTASHPAAVTPSGEATLVNPLRQQQRRLKSEDATGGADVLGDVVPVGQPIGALGQARRGLRLRVMCFLPSPTREEEAPSHCRVPTFTVGLTSTLPDGSETSGCGRDGTSRPKHDLGSDLLDWLSSINDDSADCLCVSYRRSVQLELFSQLSRILAEVIVCACQQPATHGRSIDHQDESTYEEVLEVLGVQRTTAHEHHLALDCVGESSQLRTVPLPVRTYLMFRRESGDRISKVGERRVCVDRPVALTLELADKRCLSSTG